MSSPTQSPDFIKHIVDTYADDFNGYRLDILGRKPSGPKVDAVGASLVANRRTSVSSGHGIGKTGISADAIHWFLSTRPHPAIIATANTEAQLLGKLWRELAVTNRQAKNREWFDWKQKSFTLFNDPTAQAIALPWSEDNPEAFAGTHEEHVLGIFDESSAIPKSIFNVFKGAMTTDKARWLAVGNPTRNEGEFYEITHGSKVARKPGDLERGMWKAFVIPSFDSPFVGQAWLDEMKSDLGEDTDEYRIRVLGLPPRFDAEQYIPRHHVVQAAARQIKIFDRWPLVLGVDVGHSNDRSTIVPRRGRKALDLIRVIRGERTTDFARKIGQEIIWYREEHGLKAQVVIEDIGMGVGVLETLEDMGYGDQVWGVNTGSSAYEPELYANLRAEMWARMKNWLEGEVEIPNHTELMDDLVRVKRKPSGTNNKLLLESKDQMRRRKEKSPDVADGLALTFAVDFDLLPEKADGWGDKWAKAGASSGGTWMGN
jgi:hypothetical protein